MMNDARRFFTTPHILLCCALALSVPAISHASHLKDWFDDTFHHHSHVATPADIVYMKAQTATAVVFDAADEVVGIAEITTSRASKSVVEKKAKFKLKVSVELFTGEKYKAAEQVSFSTDKDSDESFVAEDTLLFKQPFGKMPFEFAYDRDLGLALKAHNAAYTILTTNRSALKTFDHDLSFSVDIAEPPVFVHDVEMLDILPAEEPIHIKNRRTWTCDKAPTLKYRRSRASDGPAYELVGLDDPKRPNRSALKLAYFPRTGLFKGSFYLYASNACCTDRKPVVKKYRADVKGIMIDATGYGKASCKIGKRTYVWPVTVE